MVKKTRNKKITRQKIIRKKSGVFWLIVLFFLSLVILSVGLVKNRRTAENYYYQFIGQGNLGNNNLQADINSSSASVIPSPKNTNNLQLIDIFPGKDVYKTHFLVDWEGAFPSGRAVLWFEGDDNSFRMFNSWPYGRCHFDIFSWRDGVLVYVNTTDNCKGENDVQTFSPPMVYFPAEWDGERWVYSGVSNQIYSLNGTKMDEAQNNYSNQIVGWENNGQVLHWRTNQTITWKSGRVQRWQEDWYFTKVPTDDGREVMTLKRTVGGDKDGTFNWDVNMDQWVKKP